MSANVTPPLLAQSSALDEETARAEVYGVLSALFYAPPTPELLTQLRVAVTEAPVGGSFLERPWADLVACARDGSDRDIQAEYNNLFGGMGKPEVYLYASHYLSGFLNEKPLAALRSDLAQLGLTRDEAMSDTEDHLAFLLEVMRFLIAGDDVAVSNLAAQQKFYGNHLQPWSARVCEAVQAHPKARFYRAVAGFAQAFMSVEAQGFDMLG